MKELTLFNTIKPNLLYRPEKSKINLSNEKKYNSINKFQTRPKGVIIMDTFNNPFMPLKDIVLDSASSIEMAKIREELLRRYKLDGVFLPWHYTVELQKNMYILNNTRPLTYRSLLPQYEDYIVICIAGNSEEDLYTKNLYIQIAEIVLNSLIQQPVYKLQIEEIILLNLGNGFRKPQLKKLLRK